MEQAFCGSAFVASLTTREGPLSYRVWHRSAASGVAVHLHGIESHSGWFTDFGSQLWAQGLAVYCLDRIGSGRSGGGRGDIQSWHLWLNHARALVNQAKTDNPGRPAFLIASCWGAKVGLQLALCDPLLIRALVLIAPALRTRVRLSPISLMEVIASLWLSPAKYFPIPIEREEMFTTVPESIEFIRTDPLRLRSVTARFLAETRKLDWENVRKLRELSVPTLALLAGDDQIVDTPTVQALLMTVGAVEARVRAGACHSMEFPPTGAALAEEIGEWLRQYAGGDAHSVEQRIPEARQSEAAPR
jgi:acylglycerol lipase